jgi:uncharacterized protein with PIN domain
MTLCPHCNQMINTFTLAAHEGRIGTKTYKCVSFNCPHCHKCLNVTIDPLALNTDLVRSIKRA